MTETLRLYTAREAAALLKVHERTLLRWVETGMLPARRLGRLIRIEEEVLRSFGPQASGAAKVGRHAGTARPLKDKSEPRKGSPAALLRHCGRLGEEDVQAMMPTSPTCLG